MRLIKIDSNRYLVSGDSTQIEGDLETVSVFLTSRFEVDPSELEYALEQMNSNGHDTASFGVNRTLICTFNEAKALAVIPELRAIRDVREAFHRAYLDNPGSVDTRTAAINLQSLYISLNVPGILDILDSTKDSDRISS